MSRMDFAPEQKMLRGVRESSVRSEETSQAASQTSRRARSYQPSFPQYTSLERLLTLLGSSVYTPNASRSKDVDPGHVSHQSRATDGGPSDDPSREHPGQVSPARLEGLSLDLSTLSKPLQLRFIAPHVNLAV